MNSPRSNPALVNKFLAFHKDNKHVAELFDGFALLLISKGRFHVSHGTLIEQIRWNALISTAGDDFKINQNFGAFYARRFAVKFPQHAALFERRSTCADDVDWVAVLAGE